MSKYIVNCKDNTVQIGCNLGQFTFKKGDIIENDNLAIKFPNIFLRIMPTIQPIPQIVKEKVNPIIQEPIVIKEEKINELPVEEIISTVMDQESSEEPIEIENIQQINENKKFNKKNKKR